MFKNGPLVSVVIPNHNSGYFIIEAIRSALSQSYENLEIIVIDDGSTDDSVKRIEQANLPVKLIRQKNKGSASARNTGILASSGEFIALMDADDLWDRNKIQLQLQEFSSDQTILVYCSGKSFDESNLSIEFYEAKFEGYCHNYFLRYPTSAIVVLGCSSAVFRSSILKKSGLFDESFKGPAEDWDFFRRFSKYGEFRFVKDSLVNYRIHSNNLSRKSSLAYFNGNYHAIRKVLAEDLVNFERKSFLIFFRFYIISLKSALKAKDPSLLLAIVKSLVKFFKV